MCYVITAAGLDRLIADGRMEGSADGLLDAARAPSGRRHSEGERRLRQARHDVHVAGWALALMQVLGDRPSAILGPQQAMLSPPLRASPGGRVAIGPVDLRLPGGRTPHDFLRTDATGETVEVESFDTVRPDVIVQVAAGSAERIGRAEREGVRAGSRVETSTGEERGSPESRTRAVDVLVELDDRLPVGGAAAKLERYDHFLSGWSVHLTRYGRRMDSVPLVVFVCRDRARARECARRADLVLRGCRAYAGEYPFDWDYPGRERILFAAERDIHEGLLRAYGVPSLPPEVRVVAAKGDPRASAATCLPAEIVRAIRDDHG